MFALVGLPFARLAATEGPSKEPPPGPLVLELAAGALDGGAVEVWRWSTDRREKLKTEWQPVGDSGRWRTELAAACDAAWFYQVATGDRVSLPIALSPDACDGNEKAIRVIELQPAGTLAGRLKAPAGYRQPRKAQFRARRCEARGTAESRLFSFPLELGTNGSWSQKLPASCLDLGLEAPGFVVENWFELRLAPSESKMLEVRTLRPGAEVSARILQPGARLGASGQRVMLVASEEAERFFFDLVAGLRPRAWQVALSGEAGAVWFKGFPAGEYRLIVDPREPAYAPTMSAKFSVATERLTAAADLELVSSARLEVRVAKEPGTQWPDDGELEAVLTPLLPCQGDYESLVRQKIAEPARSAVFDALWPGRWQIELWERSESGHALADASQVQLAPGADAQVVLTVVGRLYRGRLVDPRAGDLSAKLEFDRRDRTAGEATTPMAKSDAGGRFWVRLPSPGRYLVRVSEMAEGANHVVRGVEFERTDREVEIVLPSSEVWGTVEDAEGRLVASGRVEARFIGCGPAVECDEDEAREHGLLGVLISPDGSFRIERIAPGYWTVDARAGRARSELARVTLGDAETLGPVRLRLRGASSTTIRLRDQNGLPIASAAGHLLLPHGGDLSGTESFDFVTDSTGDASIEGAPRGRRALLHFLDLGTVVDARWLQIDEEVEVGVDLRTTTVRFELRSSTPGATPNAGEFMLARRDGAFVPLWSLALPRAVKGGNSWEFSIERLAPGPWRLLRLGSPLSDLARLLTGQGGELQELASFFAQSGTPLLVSAEVRPPGR